MDYQRRITLYHVVDRRTRLPMLVLALLMLPLLLAPVVLHLPHDMEVALLVTDIAIWAVFTADLTVKTYLAPSRLGYLRSNWIDLLIVILPFMSGLRWLRFFRTALFLARAATELRDLLEKRHGLGYTLSIGALFVLLCATLVTLAEKEDAGTIVDFGDALWWAMVTVSTVGYGDRYPVTLEGRIVGAVLILVGICIFGVITAQFAAFFVGRERDHEVHAKLDELLERIRALESGRTGPDPGEKTLE